MKPLLVVDGYNVIGAWQEAAREAWTMDESRDRLLHRLQRHLHRSQPPKSLQKMRSRSY